jgi:hypothetical protein
MGVRWAPRTGDESHGDDAVVYVIPSAARNRDHPARGPSFGDDCDPSPAGSDDNRRQRPCGRTIRL